LTSVGWAAYVVGPSYREEGRMFAKVAGGGLIFAGAAIVVSAFLPWVTISSRFFGTVTTSGWNGSDGKITAALGVVVLALGVVAVIQARPHIVIGIIAIIAGLAATGLSIYDLSQVNQAANQLMSQQQALQNFANSFGGNPFGDLANSFSVTAGFGLFASILFSVLAIALSVGLLIASRSAGPTAQPVAPAGPPPPPTPGP
jgi:hypothetical protein